MNDLARDVLITAALNGHRQVRDALHSDFPPGDCALGVLHITLHQGQRAKAVRCWNKSRDGSGKGFLQCREDFFRLYEIDSREWSDFVHKNDICKWDFLTIARKAGTDD